MTGRRPATMAAVPIAIVAAIYLLRLDDAAGLIVDDAWYIVLAKALAQGDGYRLISSATTPILPVVPPGFPALLSMVFYVVPSFPANVVWLKALSLLAIAGLAVACWIDFTRHRNIQREQAALLVATAVLTPALVFLATSTVMAECVFALAQVGAVILTERIARRGAADHRAPAIAGLAAAAAMLIRTAGIAVIAAAIVYLALHRRWRQAAIFALTVAVCIVPWELYARAHAPTDEERAAHGGTIVYSYQRLLTMQRLNDPQSGSVPVASMGTRAVENIGRVLTRDLGAVLVPEFYRGPFESGEEVVSIAGSRGGSMGLARGTMIVSLVLAAIMVAGWIGSPRERFAMPALLCAATLAVIAPVGAETFRYIVPLAPFLVLFLWLGLRQGVVARIAVLCVLGFHVVDHTLYLQQKMTSTPSWLLDARENDELLTWMAANLTAPGAVATTNPGLVYLRTGRKTVASVSPAANWERWKALGVRYVVSTRGGQLPAPSLKPRLLYRAGRSGLWIVEM